MIMALPAAAVLSRPRLSSVHPAEWFGYQLAVKPWLRRALIVWAATHFLAIWALATAPRATAATMNAVLNWTGITDSSGVPIGAYFLSTVDTFEAVTEGGPDVSWNPGTWVQWGVHALTTGMTHETVASWIQAEASIYIFMLSTALWLLKFSMSSTWIYWIAMWVKPIFDVLHRFLIEYHFYAICLVLGIAVGAYKVVVHGHRGRGFGIILSTFVIMIAGLYVMRDPIGDLYSEDGLINQGRTLGFTAAQAAFNNGPIATGGSAGQMGKLVGLLVDALVRAPLQIWNFGTTIDNIGTCGQAWSHAIQTGVRDAPAHAMRGCGAPQALAYAQSIDSSIFAIGIGFIFLGLLFAIFVSYVSYSYAMVIGAAFVNALLSLIAAGTAMVHGSPRSKAVRRIKEFFRHAAYVFAYVLYISTTALILLRTVSPGGYAQQVGMNSPVAKLVLVAMMSVLFTVIFRWLKKEIGDHTRDTLVHTVTDSYHHVTDGFHKGRKTYDQGRDLADKLRSRRGASGDGLEDNGPEGSFTAPPVHGRPPGGNPATRRPSSLRPPHQNPAYTRPSPVKTPGAARAGSGAAAGGEAATAGEVVTVGAEAGAAVLAPEVVLPVAAGAAVVHHHRKHQQATQQPQGAANNGRSASRPDHLESGPRGGHPPLHGDQTSSSPAPVSGRGYADAQSQPRAWEERSQQPSPAATQSGQGPVWTDDPQAPPPVHGRH